MGLEDIVRSGYRKVKNIIWTPKKKEDMLKYLTDVDLRKYFKGVPEEKRQEYYNLLSAKLDDSRKKYYSHLGSWQQKAGNIGSVATILSDAYQFFGSKIALTGAQYTPLAQLIYLSGAVPEGYGMLKYIKDSKDYSSGLKWLGLKAAGLAIPLVGPLAGMNAMEKLIKQRMMKEAKNNFLKEIQGYSPKPYKALDRLAEKVTRRKIRPLYRPAFA
ncbi:hypothetical protein GOV14_04910 [Candidatus Pacearchaeota archaeon]|nr:hypothetical protein [Candidatus Pacearchaeota archaeon]